MSIALPLGLPGGLVILAAESGYFTKHGLDVTLKPTATTVAALEAVNSGQADLGMSSDTPFVFAVLQRKDVRLLARVFRSRTFVSIVARQDRGIGRPTDLRGKRIGVVPDTAGDYFLDLYLGFHGIESQAVTRVPLAVSDVERALLNGMVDAVSIWHPYSSRLMARLGAMAVAFNDPAIYQMRFDLVARPEFADKRPAVAAKFMAALNAALASLRENPDEAKQLIRRSVKEDAALVAVAWDDCDYAITLDQTLIGGLEREARWALARHKTARSTLPNFLEFIDARPLQAVQPEAVSILLP